MLTLIIIDGWGLREEPEANAIALAKTPVMDDLMRSYPNSKLVAHGEAVGLMADQMGNSNVGHLNLGAGRVVYQDVMRISKAIVDGSFFGNEVLVAAMERARDRGRLQLLGLVSDGGVHSLLDHVIALHELARRHDVEQVFVHAFLDGRDVLPRSAIGYLRELERAQREIGLGSFSTVSGRYYAMDRDKRWERMQLGLDAMMRGKGIECESAIGAVEAAYQRGEDDEFCLPSVVDRRGLLRPDDVCVLFNFRADRMRQLVAALRDEEVVELEREFLIRDVVAMTEYDRQLELPVAFAGADIVNTIGQVVSLAGVKQFRVAETEKYAHVTYFFSGGREQPFTGEHRVLVPSPRVPTYDLKPEMSAYEVAAGAVEAIESGEYGLVIVNFANPDMVGHTGILKAAVKAIEVVDECVGMVVTAAMKSGGKAVVVADHGNAEMIQDLVTGQPHTAHTTSPVPLIVIGGGKVKLEAGKLGDVAPTCLELMGIEIPPEMERSLIKR